MKVTKHLRALVAIVAAGVIIAACGTSTPPPASATINGVMSIDRTAGSAEFSVSGLDAHGGLITSGAVGFGSAQVDQAGFSVSGGVCGTGGIVNRGPITGSLTLDASGSLSTTDRSRQRATAANAFVDRMGANDRAMVTAFEGNSGHLLYAGLTSDKDVLRAAIDDATFAGGLTPLWRAAYSIVSALAGQGGDNLMALIFTDGQDTEGGYSPEQVIAHANANNVRLFMVGLGSPSSLDTAKMMNVSTQTGGLYASTSDPVMLETNFTNIFSASKASGCIGLAFDPAPRVNQTMTGSLTFMINGKPFSGEYAVTF